MIFLSQPIDYLVKFIGEYGPFMLFIVTIYLLWNTKHMFFYYTIGIFLNTILNLVLKGIFQQPRPLDNKKQFDTMIKHGKHLIFKDDGIPFNIFGMPSGHSQSCLFSSVFMFLVLKNVNLLLLYIVISLITFYYIIHNQYHSLLQIIVGGLCGSLFAYLIFYFSNQKLKGKIREKPDDNGPI